MSPLSTGDTTADLLAELARIDAIPDEASVTGADYKRACRQALEFRARLNGIERRLVELERYRTTHPNPDAGWLCDA